MICHRIYTEYKNRRKIEALALRWFKTFNIAPRVGYWQGKREECLVIEIILETDCTEVYRLARVIKRLNRQKAVLVTTCAVGAVMV